MKPAVPREELDRRAAAVRAVRSFLPAYAGLSVLLFLPALDHLSGLQLLPRGVVSWWTPILLLIMVGTAGGFLLHLAGLGQYRFGAGLRFRLVPALLDGEWVSDQEALAAMGGTAAPESPLGILAADAAEVQAAFAARGQALLAESHAAALREAESVARLVMLVTDDADPRLAPARTALAGWQDQLQLLRGRFARGEAVDPVEQAARVEADIAALRQAVDALRQAPPTRVAG